MRGRWLGGGVGGIDERGELEKKKKEFAWGEEDLRARVGPGYV